MAWTEEMVEELKRLWDEGVTTGEIGRRLNISKNSIVGKVHRLGLSGRPSPIKKKGEPKNETTTNNPAKEKAPKKEAVKVEKKETKEVPVAKEAAPTIEKKQSTPKTDPKPEKKAVVEQTPTASDEEDIKLAKSMAMQVTSSNNTANKEFLSLTDLDNHTCRWPIGDPKDENFHFCGKKVRLGQTYCEEHAAIAYVKPTKK